MAFKKTASDTGAFYQLAESTQVNRFTRKSDLTTDELANLFNSQEYKARTKFVEYEDAEFVRWIDCVPSEETAVPFGTYIYTSSGYLQREERLTPIHIRSGETYIPVGYITQLKADIDKFLASKQIYSDLGFLYRRGYLIHGPPVMVKRC